MKNLRIVKTQLLLSIIYCLSIWQDVYAQSQVPLTPVIPPSPTAQAMQKYGDIPVSAYTGVPEISIPLYTIKYHDITVPISLSYHASGIKVAEESSNVGLGWTLNAGGAISRNIIGYDDFFTNPATYLNQFFDMADGYVPIVPIQGNGILNLIKQGTVSSYNLYNYIVGGGGKIQTDFQPDQFYYNVNGMSGKFLLRRNGTPILQSLQKVDITCNSSGTSWDMKTVDGFDYQFAQPEISRSTQEATGIQHVSAIYLTQITSPTGNVVKFNYTVNSNNYEQSIGSYTQSRDDNVLNYSGLAPIKAQPVNTQSTPQIYTTAILNNIDYGTGQVVFSYASDRTDMQTGSQQDSRLNSVAVYTKNTAGVLSTTPVKTFNLGQGYATGSSYPNPAVNSTSTWYSQRMILNSITETGSYNNQTSSANPYLFTYNLPNWLPSKSSLEIFPWKGPLGIL